MTDTDFDRLPAAAPTKRQMVRFIPDVSMGTLIQLGSMLLLVAGGWATYQSDKATTRLELDQVKAAAAADKGVTKESLTDIKGDVKEIQRTLVQVNQTLAIIQANQPKGRP